MRDDSRFPTTPFDLPMTRSLGITRRHLRSAVQDGVVRRVLRGVYVRADAEDTVDLRCAATRLVIAPASIVCDRTAAWLHGVDVFGWHEHERLPPTETCVFRGRRASKRGDHDGHERDLYPRDVMNLHGIPVTTPMRTALDLGCSLPRRDAFAMLDWFMRLHGLTRTPMLIESKRYVGRRGVRQLRPLLLVCDPRAESPAESWVRLDLLDAGLRPEELQWRIFVDGVEVFRLDLAWPKHKVCVEYDGEEFHDLTAEQREHDQARRDWLEQHGWIVIVVTKDILTKDAKAEWIGRVRAALDSRARRTRRF